MEGVAQQADGYPEVIVKNAPVLGGTHIGSIMNGRLLEIITAHGDYLRIRCQSTAIEGFIKADNVRILRHLAPDDLQAGESIFVLGNSGLWKPNTIQHVQQGLLSVSDEYGDTQNISADHINEWIRVPQPAAKGGYAVVPTALQDSDGNDFIDGSGQGGRAGIDLISVEWMRSQWDCSMHCPKPGSWLMNYVTGRPVPKTFPRCQELPPEAKKYWEDVPEAKRVAVSHRWQTKEHPNPTGNQFSELLLPKRGFKVFNYFTGKEMFIASLDDDDYVYYDYLSTPQPPRDAGQYQHAGQWRRVQRRFALQATGFPEEAGFQRGLEMLTSIFEHWRSFVVFVSNEEFDIYRNRSWCLFEMNHILTFFSSSKGHSLICGNSLVYLYVSSVALSLPSMPSLVGNSNKTDRFKAAARYYFHDLSRFLHDMLRTSATDASDKGVLVREYTKKLVLDMHIQLGTHSSDMPMILEQWFQAACKADIHSEHRLAGILEKGLQYMAATSECTVDIEKPPLSIWRRTIPSMEEVRSFGDGALSLACMMERWDLVGILLTEALKDHNFLNSVMAVACKFCCLPAVQTLLSAAAAVAAGQQATEALTEHSLGSHVQAVQQLLAPGKVVEDEHLQLDAPVVDHLVAAGNAVDAGKEGWSPLLVAAEYGHFSLVNQLLAAGSVVHAADQHQVTPLMRAAQNGHVQVVERLLAAGAAVNAANDKGGTPLMLAAQSGHARVVLQLLEARAVVHAAGQQGTALQIASHAGHSLVVEQLRDWD